MDSSVAVRSRPPRVRFFALALGLSALVAGVGLARAQERPSGKLLAKTRTFWFFFAPSQTGLAKEAARIRDLFKAHPELEFRAALFVDDWSLVRKPAEDFALAFKDLSLLVGPGFSLPLWDDEGLRMARDLGVDRLPAYAVVEPASRGSVRRAHVAYGRGANLMELVRCK